MKLNAVSLKKKIFFWGDFFYANTFQRTENANRTIFIVDQKPQILVFPKKRNVTDIWTVDPGKTSKGVLRGWLVGLINLDVPMDKDVLNIRKSVTIRMIAGITRMKSLAVSIFTRHA